MNQSYKDLTSAINEKLAEIRKAKPDTMNGFSQMAQSALKEDTLSYKQKELMAMSIAIYMGGGPSVMTAAEALMAYEEFGGEIS